MDQTMFDVPDPLVVHVLLLTHELGYNVICLPHSWYPQCDRYMIYCAQNTHASHFFRSALLILEVHFESSKCVLASSRFSASNVEVNF